MLGWATFALAMVAVAWAAAVAVESAPWPIAVVVFFGGAPALSMLAVGTGWVQV
jgi:hypothetical protein